MEWWSNGVRNAECGVMEWLYSLVKVEVSVAQKWFGRITWIPDCDGRKKGHLGHYKKSFFRPLEKHCFFAVFENRSKTPVSINKYRRLVKLRIFRFCSKTGQKQAQKKYRVKPTVGYRFGNSSDRMEASMKTEDRRLRNRGWREREKRLRRLVRLAPGAVAWDRRGKAPSPRHQMSGAQSMTAWAVLKRGRGSKRFGGGCSLNSTSFHLIPLGSALFTIKIFFRGAKGQSVGVGGKGPKKGQTPLNSLKLARTCY